MSALDDRIRFATAWVTCLPVAFLLFFELSFICEHTYPVAAGSVALLVIMAGALVLLWTRSPIASEWDRNARLSVGCLCALFMWTVLTQFRSPLESGFARVGDTAMMIGMALCVLLLRPAPRPLLRAAGAAVATMTIISVVVSGVHGKLTPQADVAFGLGAVTVLGCLATPVLTAWLILLWRCRQDADRPSGMEWFLCVAGVAALMVVMVTTARRGPALGIAVTSAVLIARHAWRRFPHLTVLTVVVLGATAAAYIIPHLLHDAGSGRSERYILYRLAWAVGIDGLPFGHGPFGMLAADTLASYDALLWTARDAAALHAHNELLNAWVEGGLIQAALVVAMALLLAQRIARCADPVLKTAYVALGTAWSVHAMTDNTFGTPLGMAWSGVICGAILTLTQAGPLGSSRPLPRMLPWLAWACGLFAIGTGFPNVRMALLSAASPIQDRMTALEACRDPILIQGEVGIIVSSSEADAPVKSLAVQMAKNRIGWTASIPLAAVIAEAAQGDRRKYLQALLLVLRRNPFDLDACASIADAVRRWPILEEEVPASVRQRCARMYGLIPPIRLAEGQVVDMQIAADCLAGIFHSVSQEAVSNDQLEDLIHVARDYGQIGQVATLAVQVCSISSTLYCAQMMEHVDKIADGLGYSQAGKRALALAVTKQRAENVLPLVRKHYVTWFDRLEKQQAPAFSSPNNSDERDTWQAVVRIWSLTRSRVNVP